MTFTGKIRKYLPLFLFVVAIALTLFAYGVLVGKYRWFPYPLIASGVKTGRVLLQPTPDRSLFWKFIDTPPEIALPNRIEFIAGDKLDDPILWYGGRFQFTEYCPEYGCLAVEYTSAGEVAHTYPLRLDELEKAAIVSDEFPYEISPDYSFARDTGPIGISRYPNGDLLVTFHNRNGHTFPFGGGVARIDRDGYPLWFRRDYSHHYPSLLDDDVALVPGVRLGNQSAAFDIQGKRGDEPLSIKLCSNGELLNDTVKIIDGDGQLLQEIALIDALLESHFSPVFQHASSSCDPIHLNYIHSLREDARGTWGMEPGDLVASLRNLSAFAILDREQGYVKRLVRGTFFQQHSVQHLAGSTFLMFDNHGSDEIGGPSRLLMIDLANGQETTLFPNNKTPESLRGLFIRHAGKIDISPDRRRALVVFTRLGKIVEVRISDGTVLNAFTGLHDVSDLDQFRAEAGEKTALFSTKGIDYIHQ